MSMVYRSKNEVVYDELHRAIIRGEYASGTRIVIDDAAAKFGVSAIPIREALRQLEADGFVTIVPYAGATVTEIDAESIYEVFALLETMEAICARSATTRATDEDLDHLDTLVQQMDDCLENCQENTDRWARLNKEFHLQICDIAETRLIEPMIRKVLDHWDRLRMQYMEEVLTARLALAQEEHRQIVAAMRRRDGKEATRLLRLHNQHALESYEQFLQAQGLLDGEADVHGDTTASNGNA
ncbi:MAG: GntR family transcriptional regulator [Anaerolineae bacterium]|nr:GntR family transcriptional regulator [Anaerolineae bacterium]MCO5206836.1 GntR family transcriptional regulator [Anaerolineae bacterium]